MVNKKLLTVFIFLVIQIFSLIACPLYAAGNHRQAAGFSLPDLQDKQVSLSDYKGKPLILLFWATWCPFCREELKKLNTMQAELTKEGWEIVAIDVGENAYRVNNFVKSHSLGYRVLLDIDMTVAKSFDVLGVPTYVLLDKKGYIVFQDHYFPQKEYKELILE